MPPTSAIPTVSAQTSDRPLGKLSVGIGWTSTGSSSDFWNRVRSARRSSTLLRCRVKRRKVSFGYRFVAGGDEEGGY